MRESMEEALRDAGCSDRLAAEILEMQSPMEQVTCLECYRRKLLERIHRHTEQLDCLDYLLYHLRRASGSR